MHRLLVLKKLVERALNLAPVLAHRHAFGTRHHFDNPSVVIQAIRMVVDAVRAGQGRCPLRVVQARMPARAT